MIIIKGLKLSNIEIIDAIAKAKV